MSRSTLDQRGLSALGVARVRLWLRLIMFACALALALWGALAQRVGLVRFDGADASRTGHAWNEVCTYDGAVRIGDTRYDVETIAPQGVQARDCKT